MLERWGCPPAVSLGGLFHSVYGTTAYEPCLVSVAERDVVRGVIGAEAEELAWLFGRCPAVSLPDAVRDPVAPVLDAEWDVLPATTQQVRELAVIALANLVEQRPRTAGSGVELAEELRAALGPAGPFT